MSLNDEIQAHTSVERSPRIPETTRGVIRWLIREIVGVLIVALMLFSLAGRPDWTMAWALVGIYALWVAVNALILIPRTPELLAERASRKKSIKRWDTVILSIFGLAIIVKYIVAGLDMRFEWTGPMFPTLQMGALVVAVLGYTLVTWAMAANAFFSLIYRLQEDRGHAVATGGPYRYVRHPGYTGSIAFELATPIMLGSWWALMPGGLAALLMLIRTALEDRALREELPGYAEYAQRTQYRLLPGVW